MQCLIVQGEQSSSDWDATVGAFILTFGTAQNETANRKLNGNRSSLKKNSHASLKLLGSHEVFQVIPKSHISQKPQLETCSFGIVSHLQVT